MRRLKVAQMATVDLSIAILIMNQIRALQQMGHEVVAICAPGPWVKRIQDEGIVVETIPMCRKLSLLNDIRSLILLYRCFRRFRFDIVHTHTPKAGLLGPIAARLANVPIIIHTVHGFLFHDKMRAWRRFLGIWFERFATMFCNVLLFLSKEDILQATKMKIGNASRYQYLGNGIDPKLYSRHYSDIERDRARRELGFKEDDMIVGTVGRLVYEKGFKELFEAAKLLTVKRKDLKFIVIGPMEADRGDAIKAEEIEALKRECSILFLGWRDDVARWYSIMDIFVLPSHREGIPRACMEAASMKLPVIATDIRGCREVVSHGTTGLLVPIRNTQALIEAIQELADNKVLRMKMGEEGRKYIEENFRSEYVLERLRQCYLKCGSLL